MNTQLSPSDTLSPNRAEELGDNVWDHFVVPFFLPDIDLATATKARLLIGGRGCGKTMLLRYLSHSSQFSPSRIFNEPYPLNNIGVYWRMDTQFANTMRERGVSEDVWISAFQHATAVIVSRSILQSLQSIRDSQCPSVTPSDLEALDFFPLKAFRNDLKADFIGLLSQLREEVWRFETWANNPRHLSAPIFLPGSAFVRALISVIKEQLVRLQSVNFSVYIDEYENLLEYQQRIINTLLKHGEPPLLFHVASKKNGMRTRRTLGDEDITDIADYRIIDLDKYLHEKSFPVFAAEILFLRLSNAGYNIPFLNVQRIRDPGQVEERERREYQDTLLGAARTMLPKLTDEALAAQIFDDKVLYGKLLESLIHSLELSHSVIPAERFVSEKHKKATIVSPCIIARRKLRPEEILGELNKLDEGKTNKFSGGTNWIHNNFIGQVLLLYSAKHRVCPFYSGFDSFIYLARGNLRHFLELCYTSVKRARPSDGPVPLFISVDEQATAAKEASAALLKEIRGFGRQGNKLHSFTLALGSLFALAHSRPTQSEPEISHFSVGGSSSIRPEDQELLNEAVKWSVLFEEEETKKKDLFQPGRTQWVLNPIYAPYFGITYRKKRKLEISADDLHVLNVGTYEDKKRLLNKYMSDWDVTSGSLNLSLFSHLE